MAETATILIPDISGYTAFVSKTEIEHSSHILNHLLETIIGSVSTDFIVSEVEGDAVLLYKKGAPPSKKELVDQCVKTFTEFHKNIMSMSSTTLCQCGACQTMLNLTLKFVVHFGTIAEISVARFVKASGIDMVIAHRLLKNNIEDSEYLLMTNSYLGSISDPEGPEDMEWSSSKEDYPSIGIVEFKFACLSPIKNSLPKPANVHTEACPVDKDQTFSSEIEINVSHIEVHEAILDMEKRRYYVEGLRGGEGPVFLSLGAKHFCLFDEGKALIEPKHLEVNDGQIIYEEFATFPEAGYFAVYRFDIRSLEKDRCSFWWSISPQPGYSFSSPLIEMVQYSIATTPQRLKAYCEGELKAATQVN